MATEMEDSGTEAELLDTYLFIIKLVAVDVCVEVLLEVYHPQRKDGRNSEGKIVSGVIQGRELRSVPLLKLSTWLSWIWSHLLGGDDHFLTLAQVTGP